MLDQQMGTLRKCRKFKLEAIDVLTIPLGKNDKTVPAFYQSDSKTTPKCDTESISKWPQNYPKFGAVVGAVITVAVVAVVVSV